MNLRESIKVRRGKPEDYQFLYQLHQATMKEHISKTWGWDEAWQKEYFHEHFIPEDCQVILLNNEEIGVLVTRETEGSVFIREIQVSTAFQNRGIGTYILKRLIDESRLKNKTVALQALKINPACHLYKRLGFRVTEESDLLYFMESVVE